jgi:hypothetical protein
MVWISGIQAQLRLCLGICPDTELRDRLECDVSFVGDQISLRLRPPRGLPYFRDTYAAIRGNIAEEFRPAFDRLLGAALLH